MSAAARERFRELVTNPKLHTHAIRIGHALVWSPDSCKSCVEIEALWKRMLDMRPVRL